MRVLIQNNKNTVFALLLFLVVFVTIVFSQYRMGTSYVDSDMAAEMVLAEQLNDEGVLLSRNWYYSTEIRIIGEPTLLALTQKIFPNNWHAARVLAKAITMLIFAATVIYLCKVIGLGQYGLWAATMLICPFGFWHAFHSVFGPFYMTHMIYVNIILALIIDIANHDRNKKVLWVFLVLCSFVAGLGGIRILLMLIVPELVAVAVLWTKRIHDEKTIVFCNDWYLRLLEVSIIAAIAAAIGYMVNSLVIYKLYSIVTIKQTWNDFSLTALLDAWSWLLELFGFPVNDFFEENVTILSMKGVILGAGGLSMALVVSFAFFRLKRIFNVLNNEKSFVYILTISIIVIDGIVFALGDGIGGSNGCYWLPVLSILLLTVIIWIDSEIFVLKGTRIIVKILISLIIFSTSACIFNIFSQTNYRHPIGIENVTKWLQNNGYNNGYSSFWNGHIVEEISNGEIEMWVVDDLQTLQITNHMLQSKKHDYSLPEGKIFILTRDQELDYISSIDGISEHIVYQDENGFAVLGFSDSDELDNYIDVK